MTSKHHKWQQRWTVDQSTAAATHESGLVVRFLPLPLTDAQKREHEADAAIGKCWTPDGREWGVVATPTVLDATFEALKEKKGPHNAPMMIARLAREAGELWVGVCTRPSATEK